MLTMRDTFLNRLYEIAEKDKDVILLSVDFGAPALDKYRVNLSSQYINMGISEQNAILTATGLAIKGKKVYVIAIVPFITLRCFEQTKIYIAESNLPIKLIGVGAGVSYDDSGPTHHGIDDISLMRTLPNFSIISPSDNIQTKFFSNMSYELTHPCYIRLDRLVKREIYNDGHKFKGIEEIFKTSDITIIATGNMVSEAIEICEKLKDENITVGLLDAHILPIGYNNLKEYLKNVNTLITLEEHTLPGGFGSSICEIICDYNINIKLKRFGFDFSKGLSFHYGGRQVIQKEYGIDKDTIIKYIRSHYV